MNVFELSEQYVEESARLWPVLATFQGVPGHDGEWNDYSLQGIARSRAMLDDFRRRAVELEPAANEILARDFLLDIIDRNLLYYGTDDALRDLNSMDSPVQHMRMVFDFMEGWDDIVRRLETVGEAVRAYTAVLEEGRRHGVVAAKRQVHAVLEQCRLQAGVDSYFFTLLQKEGAPATLPAAVDSARAAFGGLADYLERAYLPCAAEHDAVGPERYAREVRRFLGTDVDLQETYTWGWSEVRRIHARMVALAGGDLAATLEKMNTDPARSAPSQEAFLAFISALQARALADLQGTHFEVPAEIQHVEVKLAPPGGPLGAYYVPPSEDFSRKGSIWYSLGDSVTVPLWDQVSTAYHEGFPGHHLQCGLQVWMRDRLSRIQRLDGWSGYAEGWALYTELLMQELGYYENPDYELGMLACQMMRACRIVVDIGSHLELPIPDDAPYEPGERWKFSRAVRMLTTMAGMAHDHAESEVTRYLGWPGQAISYKVGERLILALREEMKERMGAAFELSEFHRRVLGCGNVALGRLRGYVLA